MIWNLKVQYVKSFLPNETNPEYDLIDLGYKYPGIVELFKEDIHRLENSEGQCIVCFRGDSKENLESHKDFFEKDLSKIFMVGSKSRSNDVRNIDDPFEFYKGKPKIGILEDLEELITVCNLEIQGKPAYHPVRGTLNKQILMEYFNGLSEEELEHWRLVFISFLHNNGKGRKYKKFKDYSPFTSLTYGKHKGRIARKFATRNIGSGIVYIISINKQDKNYIKTIKITDTLKKYGVNWYEDIHSEMMVLNGIFPHDILGVMEVKRNRTPMLVINPWLFSEYLNDKRFDLKNGIPVNQKSFKKWIEEVTNYQRYSWKDYQGNHFIEEINQERRELNKFK